MQEYDITLLQFTRKRDGFFGRVYYYQGNFFYPLSLPGAYTGIVERSIRDFTKANKALITRERAHPDYLTIGQLCDLGPQHKE